jgi:hypothetical protein
MSERVVVRTFNYRHEAEFMRGVLDGHGIEASVVSDDCGAVDPALGLVRGIHLLVGKEQAEQARSLLNADSA